MLVLVQIWQREQNLSSSYLVHTPIPTVRVLAEIPIRQDKVGKRHQLNYQQWLELLGNEATAVALQQPENLQILLGDSISLWFPLELLPPDNTWLNQGISGETSVGLLRRLNLLGATQPKAIFVMVGINDLIQGVGDETIIANQRLIVRYLRRNHPRSKIILQSILPHSEQQATWEGRDRLLEIPNQRIDKLNQRLESIAKQEDIIYLDLYSLFADNEGKLRTDLTTDGLHLNTEGYKLWRIALQICIQLEVDG